MTTLAKLLAEKQQLIERLEKNPDPQERGHGETSSACRAAL
jgi:hypothetical protein